MPWVEPSSEPTVRPAAASDVPRLVQRQAGRGRASRPGRPPSTGRASRWPHAGPRRRRRVSRTTTLPVATSSLNTGSPTATTSCNASELGRGVGDSEHRRQRGRPAAPVPRRPPGRPRCRAAPRHRRRAPGRRAPTTRPPSLAAPSRRTAWSAAAAIRRSSAIVVSASFDGIPAKSGNVRNSGPSLTTMRNGSPSASCSPAAGAVRMIAPGRVPRRCGPARRRGPSRSQRSGPGPPPRRGRPDRAPRASAPGTAGRRGSRARRGRRRRGCRRATPASGGAAGPWATSRGCRTRRPAPAGRPAPPAGRPLSPAGATSVGTSSAGRARAASSSIVRSASPSYTRGASSAPGDCDQWRRRRLGHGCGIGISRGGRGLLRRRGGLRRVAGGRHGGHEGDRLVLRAGRAMPPVGSFGRRIRLGSSSN